MIVSSTEQDPLQILASAKNILLVDWPEQGIPRALINAGFNVYCYSPNSYTQAGLFAEPPQGISADNIIQPPKDEKYNLVFQKLTGNPGHIDIVNIYRPEAEIEGIIQNHVLPLGASVVWLHPPVTSPRTNEFAEKYGLTVVEGENIAAVARLFQGR